MTSSAKPWYTIVNSHFNSMQMFERDNNITVKTSAITDTKMVKVYFFFLFQDIY